MAILGRRRATAGEGSIAADLNALRHPDVESAWVIVLIARFDTSIAHRNDLSVDVLTRRLVELSATAPLVAARLRDGQWEGADVGSVSVSRCGDPVAVAPTHPFVLDREPPLRVTVAADQSWVMLCGHHFAFDGLEMVSMLAMLAGGPPPVALVDRRSPRLAMPWASLRRMAAPADRVAPSAEPPPAESMISLPVSLDGKEVTARLADACVRAVRAHNETTGWPCRRVGVSVALGGASGERGSYRRVDIPAGADARSCVAAALATAAIPIELVHAPPVPRALMPLVRRLSDTILVSNLGRREIPGAQRLDFFPVARGRSAVAFGIAGLSGAGSTLTIRARYLDIGAAGALLDGVIARFTSGTSSSGTSSSGSCS